MTRGEATPTTVRELRIFYIAAFVFAALSILSLALLLTGAVSPTWPYAVMALVFVPGWVVAMVFPAYAKARNRGLKDVPSAVRELYDHMRDVDAIRREYNRLRSEIEAQLSNFTASQSQLAGEQGEMTKVLSGVVSVLDQERADRAQLQAQQRRWFAASREFMQGHEAVLQNLADLNPEYADAARRTVDDFVRTFGPLGVQILRPQPTDSVDARIHRIIGTEPVAGQREGTVVRCVRWGYVLGEEIVPAEVVAAQRALDRDAEASAPSGFASLSRDGGDAAPEVSVPDHEPEIVTRLGPAAKADSTETNQDEGER